MKIVVIGAGSASFGLKMVADTLRATELRGRDVTLALVDVDEAALERMRRAALRMRDPLGSDVRIEATTDRRQALPGAGYVITSVERQRWPLWEQDFRVPLAHGFRHVLGENGGPGALFHALRNFELVIPMCRDIEELCPEALVLNFTNPETRLLHAICHLTRVKAAGLCHGVFGTLNRLTEYLGRPLAELKVVSAGMNHFFCILEVRDRKTGEDLLPRCLEAARRDTSRRATPLYRKFAEVFDVLSIPTEDHLGEYVAYGSEFHGVAWHYGIERRPVRTQAAPAPDVLQEYVDGKRPADDPLILAGSAELALPIIGDMELKRDREHPAINVLNTDGYIPNLPRDAAVEVPGRVRNGRLEAVHVGPVPEPMAAYMRTQFSIHSLLTEAYRTRSRKLLLQALLLDPVVNSITEAEKLLDEMLALQADFLPTFQ